MMIRGKLVLAFALVLLLGTAMSGLGLRTVGELSELTDRIYEGPLISGQVTQAAQADFLRLRWTVDALSASTEGDARQALLDRAGEIDQSLRDNLDLAADRMVGEDAVAVEQDIRAQLAAWDAMRADVLAAGGQGGGHLEIFSEVEELFELLVEYSAEQGFLFRESALEAASAAVTEQIVLGALLAVIVVIALLMLDRSISRPVRGMTQAMQAIADGNLEAEVPARGRRDEIGRMALAVEVFRANAEENARLVAEREAAERHNKAQERSNLVQNLAHGFESAIGGIVVRVAAHADDLNAAAEEMAESARTSERDAEAARETGGRTAAEVATVEQATNDLTDSIQLVNEQVDLTRTVVADAHDKVTAADDGISTLHSEVDQIGEVVSMINDVANQTNLLALNATIEAARAGEAGKGFAVVAGEVKALASQTGHATQRIVDQIGIVQASTNDAVKRIKAVAESVLKVTEISRAVSAAMEEQNAATLRIADNVAGVANGTREASDRLHRVGTATRTGSGVSKRIVDISTDLHSDSAALGAELSTFLDKIRA